MKVICAPLASLPPARGNVLRYVLYDHVEGRSLGSAGSSLTARFRQYGLEPAPRAWDFLSIALAVLAADEGVSRASSPDGWTRELDLSVSVADPAFWTAHMPLLESALRFLTGDIWSLTFFNCAESPDFEQTRSPHAAQAVCLLSGGADSLVGAIDSATTAVRPMLVSQIAKGDKETQSLFAATIGGGLPHLQLNHQVRPPGPSERSQRARSMIFIAYGLIAATSLDRYRDGAAVDLVMPENGYISLNIPLTPLRIGSLSTRTTHPAFLSKIQALFDAAELRVKIRNPYQFKTKGEMLKQCTDQHLLEQHIFLATSCGRYARSGFQHCGRCVPCLIRRAAIHHWGIHDATTYRYANLSIPDHRHRNFDDVRSAAVAVEQVRLSNVERWIGGSLNSAELGDVSPYIAIAKRGITELGAFLKASGVL